jgi:hypothetical protein
MNLREVLLIKHSGPLDQVRQRVVRSESEPIRHACACNFSERLFSHISNLNRSDETEVDDLISNGLLAAENRQDYASVQSAFYAFLDDAFAELRDA